VWHKIAGLPAPIGVAQDCRTAGSVPARVALGRAQSRGNAGADSLAKEQDFTFAPPGRSDTKAAGVKPKNSRAESAAVHERGPLRKQALTIRDVSSAMRPGLLIWYFSCVPSTSFQLRKMASRSRSGPSPDEVIASVHEMNWKSRYISERADIFRDMEKSYIFLFHCSSFEA
jgi:hypothetical protein